MIKTLKPQYAESCVENTLFKLSLWIAMIIPVKPTWEMQWIMQYLEANKMPIYLHLNMLVHFHG